jgi:HD-GYP domain-containing protein (c-di-GMP phosphodiesterase class II)
MAPASLQSLGYLPVAAATLGPSSALPCDLFVQRCGSPFAEMYQPEGTLLEERDLVSLKSEGVDHLYIRVEDAELYRRYLCEHVLHESSVAVPTRISALREVTRVAFQDALAAGDCDEMVGVATEFGRDLAQLLSERPLVFRELFHTLEHDYYTFTHVCNVSMYCVILARRLGTTDTASLAELATGALLHDIGKRHIPAHVLNKPGKLTDGEWELIRAHPTSGFRELVTRDDLTWPQLMMVYQHHERLDGSGYPTGVLGDEMHLWSRWCAVADVFDALTCQRPYRKAVPVPEVCDYLCKNAGRWFDAEAVACWSAHIRSSV